MKYLSFFLFIYMLVALVYAGPQDKWVLIESQPSSQLNGIALLLAIGAFAWVYVIYKDARQKKRRK